MTSTAGHRSTAADRKVAVLDAALTVFAERGLYGASTEEIARRAGISQPYVFRLFGTKKELYLAVVARCFRQTLELMQRAAEGKRGEEALQAIGAAYRELLASDRLYLRAQMQAYAASEDPDVAAVARGGYGDLVAYVERVSGLGMDEIARFFANGMLMNVLSSLQAPQEEWGRRLLEGCKDGLEQ
jgi:AcrR family transcriptional regulator